MMTIGFDAKRAFKNFSGLGNYSRSMIRALAQYYPGNRYVLYTPPFEPHPALNELAHIDVTIRTPKGAGAWSPSLWRMGGLGFPAALQEEGVQVFHGLSGELPYHTLPSLKMVVTMHDVIFMRYPEYYSAIDRFLYEKKFRHACRRADKIIAISQQTKDDLIQFFEVDHSKITVIYQGCDTQFTHKPPPDVCAAIRAKYRLPEQYILSVGTIEERKNLVTIMKALAMLPSSLHIVALGRSTSYMDQVRREIERHCLASRVHFIHDALFSDFPALYANARALVYPSLFEGFGIPVLEGLTAGIPVITSNISSMPEAGGDAALYIHPLDAKEIAHAILSVIEDRSLAEGMVERGFKHALRFRDEEIASMLHRLYTQLIS